jgi:signal transduction histidine kinase
MKDTKLWQSLKNVVARICGTPDDDDDMRLQKEILVITTLIIIGAGIVWGCIYLYFGEFVAGTIPLLYSVLSASNILLLRVFGHYRYFRSMQLLFILLLPFLLLLALGGFINSSGVVLWSLLAPVGALLCGQARQAVYWLAAYIVLLILGGLLQPYLPAENTLPDGFILFFFVVNIGAVSAISFTALHYFVRQKDLSIELMRKHRELEQAYVQQEIMLRQNEKLATLGKLSSGIAHELNNPASAAQRSAKQLSETVDRLEKTTLRIGQLNLSGDQLRHLEENAGLIRRRTEHPVYLNPLIRSDREYELEAWLKEKGVENAWELAPVLVELGYTGDELTELIGIFPGESFPKVVAVLCNLHTARTLLDEIGRGVTRITGIVDALKSYSYLDQAPVQAVDVHEGLNDTLVILKNRLSDRIQVHREYTDGLPRIEAMGSELNQVWTNIIDNAVSAMQGEGEITLKTYSVDSSVVVEIKDSGPGIPEDIQPKIFDPFFTTKPPGEGSGLGLNICHNIIVQKHKGTISVRSKPGETVFEVRLPIQYGGTQSET